MTKQFWIESPAELPSAEGLPAQLLSYVRGHSTGPQTFVRFDSAARSVRIDNGTKTPQEHQVKRTVEAMEIMREIRRSTGHQ